MEGRKECLRYTPSEHGGSVSTGSEELKEWIRGYQIWKDSVPVGLRAGGGASPSHYPGGPPPVPEFGDPHVRAKIKCANQDLEKFKRTAEMAMELHSKSHPWAADFEVVELLSGNEFWGAGCFHHINFKIKPKSAADDDQSQQHTLFAEYQKLPTFDLETDLVTEGKITMCSCLREGSNIKDYCGRCSVENGVRHPNHRYQGGQIIWEV